MKVFLQEIINIKVQNNHKYLIAIEIVQRPEPTKKPTIYVNEFKVSNLLLKSAHKGPEGQ